jgi:hypothetical protein
MKIMRNLAKWGLIPGLAGLAVASFVAIGTRPSGETEASSHREAPAIANDPQADATDTYAFIAPDSPDKVTLVGNWIPLQEPAGGPNFYPWATDATYAFAIDSDGDSERDIAYEFEFYTEVLDPSTFLYATGPITSLDDPNFNIRQYYDIYKRDLYGQRYLIASDLAVPPDNIGPVSTPNYETLALSAVHTLPGGIKVFAGQRDDPFFVDLGAIFDLATIRQLPGNAGNGIDNVAGFNVSSIVLQVPIKDVTDCRCDPAAAPEILASQPPSGTNLEPTKPAATAESTPNPRTKTPKATTTPRATRTAQPTVTPTAAPTQTAPNAIIGVWTDTYRERVKVLNSDGTSDTRGKRIKVSRLGNPLVNEVVIPLAKKDAFNASYPEDDAQFAAFVLNSDLAEKLNIVYNGIVNPIPETGRTDLVAVFLTGIPGLNQPPNVVASEQLRINLAIKPASCGTVKRLGVIAGDNCGFPNGRRLGDDVTDVAVRAVACGYGFNLGPCVDSSPNNLLGDGVNQNDKAFTGSFPYVASPFSGFNSPHNTSPVPPIAAGFGAGVAVVLALVAGTALWSRLRRRNAVEAA